MVDPTRKQLLKTLESQSDDEFEIEEAIYWFAADYHRGQASNLYSVLSTSPYKPGITQRRPHGEAAKLFNYLQQIYSEPGDFDLDDVWIDSGDAWRDSDYELDSDDASEYPY